MTLIIDNRKTEYEKEIINLGKEKTRLIIEIEKLREELKSIENKRDEVKKELGKINNLINQLNG